jgi:RNA polymerase sigma factor (sigma-70 family)
MNKLPTLRNLVACNKVELAIQKFIEWAPAYCSGHVDDGVMLAYRFASARGNSHTGIISWKERMQQEKSVVGDFMELLQTCEREQNELMADDPPGESAASGNQNRTLVEIVLVGDLPNFPSRRQKLFLLLLGLILNIDFQQILIKKIEKGSIVLVLEMPRDSALELRQLFEEDAPELQPLLDEFTVLKTPRVLAPEPVQLKPAFFSRRIKIGASKKINSVQDFREVMVAHGQEYAMSQLYQQTFYPLKSKLKNAFGEWLNNESIEDVISEAFLKILSMAQSGRLILQEPDKFFSYVYRIASRGALYTFRGKPAWKLTEKYPESFDPTDEEDSRIDIREAFAHLSERHQKLFTLYYYEEKSDKEIAQLLKYKNANVVRALRHRILKKLKQLLE